MLRYRYSHWDALFGLALAAVVTLGWRAWLAAPDTIALHYGLDGTPDRWGPPSLFLLIGLPLLLLVSAYPPLRGIDLYLLARKPKLHGFITHVGGGAALLCGLLGTLPQLDILAGIRPGGAVVLGLVGLFYVYLGLLFRCGNPERIPWNTSGLFADTPTGRAAVAKGMGAGLIASGLVTLPLAWLPGELALVSLVPLSFGPLVGVAIGLAAKPKG